MYQQSRVTVIIPALDEAASIGLVIRELWRYRDDDGHGVIDEIIVCDNGSIDNTAPIATRNGAIVVHELRRGYGAACQRALREYDRRPSNGSDILLFVDADHSVDTSEIGALLQPFDQGADLIIGDRNTGHAERGSMSPQQIFGNKVATALVRWMWQTDVNDLGPFRAIRARALKRIAMRDQAYGWTIEMQIRAIQESLRTVEVPVTTLRRIGHSKIGGTLTGSLKAGYWIISTALRLKAREWAEAWRVAISSA